MKTLISTLGLGLVSLVLALPVAHATTLQWCPDGHGGTVLKNESCTGTWADPDASPPAVAPPEVPSPAPSVTPVALLQTLDHSVAEALKALRKVRAATQVGITKMAYGTLVVEAQSVVSEIVTAPGATRDTHIKQELDAAMHVYADALTLWHGLDDTGGMGGSLAVNRLVKTYRIPVIWKESNLAQLWHVASDHLARATDLAK